MNLKAGAFYWVKPVFDVDLIPPGFEDREYDDDLFDASYNHWSNQYQPARFEGYSDNGEERWVYLGEEGVSEWPVCWVGAEITAKIR